MTTYLFLDDLRNPEDVTWVKMPANVDWSIVRSYNEAVAWIKQYGWPQFIAFDHDLSDIDDTNPAHLEKTGYDFAKFLIDYAIDVSPMPDNFDFVVHSKNYIGFTNIKTLLDNYIKVAKNDK